VPGGPRSQRLDPGRQLVDRHPEPGCQSPEQLVVLERAPHGGVAGDRLDAADTGADAALADDQKQANLGRAVHMRAAAQLGGEATERDDPDILAVFLTEERDGPVPDRIRVRLDLGGALGVP
jgi:hypothetical protein